MNSVGIICEYNPFHNGHLYHLNEVKKLFPNTPIILIMSGHFTQRGIPSIINKWEKTKLALDYGIDLVIELPFVFASQSADIFAKGSIELLKELKVSYLVFGSETNDVDTLINLAKIQINNPEYDQLVKSFLDKGYNYPTALSKALTKISKVDLNNPNDILGLAYIKEIIKQKAKIKPITIKRTVGFHSDSIIDNITSASNIRQKIYDNQNIEQLVPKPVYNCLTQCSLHFTENYFPLLKYKIMIESNLEQYQTVDEGIENRIDKCIITSISTDQLVNSIKTKRYTYNKIMRMLTHILCSFTKQEAININNEYIRLLGFSKIGQTYLNKIKKDLHLPIITNYKPKFSHILDIEIRATKVYASTLNEKDKISLIEKEFKQSPLQK